jgi:plastocyanin
MRFCALLSAAALSAGLATSSFAQITGKVTLAGKPPEMKEIAAIKATPQCAAMHKDPVYEDTVVVGDKGELANVVIYVKGADSKEVKGAVPKKPAVLDQKGCVYVPHVVAVMVGQEVDVKNSDPFMHNVHSLAIDNQPFNFAQPVPSEKKLEPFHQVENIKVKCDVHPWMSAYIVVLDNPYFAVSDEDGKYTIDGNGLPDGTYDLYAWQEKYGESKPQKVTVKGGKADKPVDFTFQSKSK